MIRFKRLMELNEKNIGKINDNLTKIITNEDLICNLCEKVVVAKRLPSLKTKVLNHIVSNVRNKYEWQSTSTSTRFKKRDFRILHLEDKLLLEGIRIILNIIYEPLFQMLDVNHSFRSNRNMSTAIEKIIAESRGMTTLVKGTFEKTHNNIDIKKLIKIMERKIGDQKLLKVIRNFLNIIILNKKTGETRFHKDELLQKSAIGHILFNIFMHEFDRETVSLTEEILKKKNEVEERIHRTKSETYAKIDTKIQSIIKSMKKNKSSNESGYFNTKKQHCLNTKLKKLVVKKRYAKSIVNNKEKLFFSYTRYEDSWLLMTNADAKTCQLIKKRIMEWAEKSLKIQFDKKKTLVINTNKEQIEFLDFNIYKETVRFESTKYKNNIIKRKLDLRLTVSYNSSIILEKLKKQGFINKRNLSIHVSKCMKLKPWQIVQVFNRKILEVFSCYHITMNRCKLNYFYYLLQYSCYKTLAVRFKTTITGMLKRYGSKAIIEYETFDIDGASNRLFEKRRIRLITRLEAVNWLNLLVKKRNNNAMRVKTYTEFSNRDNDKKIHRNSKITPQNDVICVIS